MIIIIIIIIQNTNNTKFFSTLIDLFLVVQNNHKYIQKIWLSVQKVSRVGWKCPGPDIVQGYWLKKFRALHERIATQMDNIINNGMEIPK